MPIIQEGELKKQITQQNFAMLYVLFGQEKFLLKKAANSLIKKAGAVDVPEFNFNEFGADAEIDKIADAVQALPLMAEKKCVVVSDFNPDEKNAADLKKVNELLNDLSDTTVLIFYFPTADSGAKPSAKWRNFLKLAAEKGMVTEFAKKDFGELSRRVIKEAEKKGCELSRRNAEMLVEYTGNELLQLMNEIQKLCAYANGAEITSDMIELLVAKNVDTTVFMLADSLAAGNYEKSYQLMKSLIESGEEPVAVLAALSSAYVDMMRVKAATQSGFSSSEPAKYGDYKGREFRLRKAERSAKNLTLDKLREILKVLLETDISLKSSKIAPQILLDLLIAKILLCTKGDEFR